MYCCHSASSLAWQAGSGLQNKFLTEIALDYKNVMALVRLSGVWVCNGTRLGMSKENFICVCTEPLA
jgi:hypothetical protein